MTDPYEAPTIAHLGGLADITRGIADGTDTVAGGGTDLPISP